MAIGDFWRVPTLTRSDISFLLGFEPIALKDVDPNRTVLDWLRESMALTGTKEGCAEGDCGACTVVLAEAKNGELHYRPVNACILFLPQLDGRQLITVEHLKDEAGKFHPIQQAMVDHHGSQCGFLHARLRSGTVCVQQGVQRLGRSANARGHLQRSPRKSLPLHRLPTDPCCERRAPYWT